MRVDELGNSGKVPPVHLPAKYTPNEARQKLSQLGYSTFSPDSLNANNPYTQGDPIASTAPVRQNLSRDVGQQNFSAPGGMVSTSNLPIDWGATNYGRMIASTGVAKNTSHSVYGGYDEPATCPEGGCYLDSTVKTIPRNFPVRTFVSGPRSIAKSLYGEAPANRTQSDPYVRHPYMYKSIPDNSLYGANLGSVDALGNTINLHGMVYPYTNRDVRELNVEDTKLQPYPSIVRWTKYPVQTS
jgi:hypothetical protein